jgi:hypothetical protein
VQPWFTRRRGLAAGLASAGIGAGTLVVPLLATALIGMAVARRDAGAGRRRAAAGPGRHAAVAPRARGHAAGRWRRGAGAAAGPGAAQPAFRWLYAMCLLGAPAMFIPFAHVSAAARDLGVSDVRRPSAWSG